MPDFRLSKLADGDIVNIAQYTIEQFGIKQARTYRDSLAICFHSLAKNPKLGRVIDHIGKGLRCYDHKSHAVFYKVNRQDILIIRILHKSMDAHQHL